MDQSLGLWFRVSGVGHLEELLPKDFLHTLLHQDSGFRVYVLGFRVQGSGFRVQGSGCRVQGSGFRVQGAGCRVQGSWLRVEG